MPVAAQLSGWNPQALYAAVEAGHPVLVWTTVDYSSQTARTWKAWDGRTVPWTEAGHVVVLMGVNPKARTLEFSDPLTGSYNGTTMAQFAGTFTIYGDMAIVIERVARASAPHVSVRHVVTATHHAAPATPIRTPRTVPWVPIHHVRVPSALNPNDTTGVAAVSLGLRTGVTAAATHSFRVSVPLMAAGSFVVVTAGAMLAVLLRRRRLRCAG